MCIYTLKCRLFVKFARISKFPKMNKLQLYIYKSLRGFKSVRNINPSENVQRHILDVRNALATLDYNPAEKYLFYLISYVDEGSFFTILRTIPSEPLDHLATTIFVPRGLQISPDDMDAVVRRTTRMVSNPSVSAEELAELHSTFAREYAVDRDAPMTVASEGRVYAWCRYGGDTGRSLRDFYGPALYQPAYLPYAGVLLVDADLGVKADVTDLTDMPLATVVPMLPPESSPEGFTPHIYHHLFDRPFAVPLGGTVDIVWRRAGFEDRSQQVLVERAGQEIEPASTAESRKAISPASFYITSQSSKAPITDAVITVNGVEISEARYFTQADLKNADVIIRCQGYFPFHGHLDLAATTQALIQLQEQRRVYRFELPVKSSELGAPIRFEIHSKRDLTESPIEGYVLLDAIREGAGRINHLEYTGSTPGASRRMTAIIAAVALVVGILVGWLIGRPSSPRPEVPAPGSAPAIEASASPAMAQPASEAAKPQAQEPAPTVGEQLAAKPAAAAQEATGPVSAQAIAYLDQNKRWDRLKMEKLGIGGLFDDMNNFRFARLTDYWAPRLDKSKNYAEVVKAVRNGSYKPKVKALAGTTYNKAGDNIINWRSYTYHVDP